VSLCVSLCLCDSVSAFSCLTFLIISLSLPPRAHTLSLQIKSATYDASTYSVIFDFTKPMETPRAYRVEVSQERVYGARGEEDILKRQLYSAYIL
jgi:hypothetical protein